MSTFEEILHATVTADQRKAFAKAGVAMPGGRYYIRNASDLQNAILGIGRAGGPNGTEKDRNAARKHCIARAKALGLSDKIPDTWNADGTLKHSDTIDGIIAAILPTKEDAKQEGVAVANTTAAIMALPAPLADIRLVGDEEKHATLLFFGETNSLPDDAKNVLVESIKMACSMLWPFAERIREITRLGNDVPPALVAMLSDQCLSQIRNLFMMNPAVNGYLGNVQQFPSFTPHVTLGHPDFAEEAILRTLANQLDRVRFDRLAVWWNDERIECPLSGVVAGDWVAMSDTVDEFMEHHGFLIEADEEDAEQAGVKGMHWGIRRRVDPKTGLVARTSSADQIHVDRIAKKLHSGGVSALSNKDLQEFSTRIQREQEFNRALSSQEAQRSKPFIQRFLATQGKRQFTRVTDKAIDIAVEKALQSAGIQIGKKGGKAKDLADILTETGVRLEPKKKKPPGGGNNP